MAGSWIEQIKLHMGQEGWKVECENGQWRFSQMSHAGQDCGIEVEAATPEELCHELCRWCDDYDVSEETYKWLDSFGHGMNGAPYDMRDVLDDMEWFETQGEELRDWVAGMIQRGNLK